MKKQISIDIVCPYCEGTGVYSGIGETGNVAVVCNRCEGSGKYHYEYSYEEFTERKEKKGIDRVYLDGYGYKISTGEINFSGIGVIDMDKEGVSYQEFLEGKMPKHIKSLACPMLADQSACHRIKGFIDTCQKLNSGWISCITHCKYQKNKSECWDRFYKSIIIEKESK